MKEITLKILLLNDSTVVTKLVTLSAQKTSDELEVVRSIDDISENSYDLLVVDDTVYTPHLVSEIKEKITFSQSPYICLRNAVVDDTFTSTIKKPFLPTDLVSLFSAIAKKIEEIDTPETIPYIEDDTDEDEAFEGVLDKDELQAVQDLLDDVTQTYETQEISIESEIQSAVSGLTQEDLESEIDEDDLLNILRDEIDTMDEESLAEFQELKIESDAEQEFEALEQEFKKREREPKDEGIELLKKLLDSLSSEGVVASMKGMKISINIELGDNK